MTVSMTGFAVVSVPLVEATTEEHCALEIEIKTLNGRFFEPQCKLPSILSAQELEITQRMKTAFQRGRVYCAIRVNGFSAGLEKLIFSPARLNHYLEVASLLRTEYGMSGSLSIAECMQLPGLFGSEKAPLDEGMLARFFAGFDEAIAAVSRSREQEGRNLALDLHERCERARHYIDLIAGLSREILVTLKEELSRESAKAQAGDEAARALLSERYAQLDKADIHEEVTRFNSHLKAFREALESATPEKGRRLDFILQELLRESNTITAKCTNFQITSAAVEIKVELEKAREQVQNIV